MRNQTAMLIEILAIKLYEHDFKIWPPPAAAGGSPSWQKLDEDDKQEYRDQASGTWDRVKTEPEK